MSNSGLIQAVDDDDDDDLRKIGNATTSVPARFFFIFGVDPKNGSLDTKTQQLLWTDHLSDYRRLWTSATPESQPLRMLAICCVQPADLIKTRMQLMGAAGKSISSLGMAREIMKKEGFIGFYTGLSAALFRQATYTTGRLGVFNALFDYYKASYGVPNFGVKVGLGVIAGGVGAFIGTPAEVALIRMTADGRLPPEQRRNYRHIFDALGRIIREEGVTTLWRGAVATVTRAMVVNAAQLGTYAQTRESLLPTFGDGIFLHFTASMIAGFVTSLASLPVDIVKTRVQNSTKGASQLQVLLNIIKNEGVLTLWSGFLPTYAKIGPHTVLTFIFLEQLNKLYRTFVA